MSWCQPYSWSGLNIFAKVVLIFELLQSVTPQTFIRNCNDPAIVLHMMTFVTHTYCAHACRPGDEANGRCGASGNCLCSPPCSNTAAAPPIAPANDLCPRQSGDPRDPDPMFSEANCMASCAGECGGGTGLLCEEVNGAIFTPNTFASICVCSCPTVLCSAVTPAPTPTTTTTISPIVLPIVNATTSIALYKVPLYFLKKKKKKIWIILKKLWLCCILFVKLFFLKSLLLGLYFYVFWDYIDMDLRLLEWIVASVF